MATKRVDLLKAVIHMNWDKFMGIPCYEFYGIELQGGPLHGFCIIGNCERGIVVPPEKIVRRVDEVLEYS